MCRKPGSAPSGKKAPAPTTAAAETDPPARCCTDTQEAGRIVCPRCKTNQSAARPTCLSCALSFEALFD